MQKEREIFGENGVPSSQRDRKVSTSSGVSTVSIKNKWLKAFKSLKAPGSSSSNADK